MLDASGRISVLHVDDEATVRELTVESLEQIDDRFDVDTATSVEEGLAMIRECPPDCVVSEYDLSGTDGLSFLAAVREEHPELPFILFTGKGSERIASDAISAGVTDYLQKGSGIEQYELLSNRIDNAVTAREAKQRADERVAELQQILKTVPAAVARVDRSGEIVFANERATEWLDIEPAVDGQSCETLPWELTGPDGQSLDGESPFERVLTAGEPVAGVRRNVVWPDGRCRTVEINGEPLFDEGGTVESAVFSLTDITAEVERTRELERHEMFLEYSPDFITVMTESGTIEYQSAIPEYLGDFELPNLVGKSPREYIHPDDQKRARSAYERVLEADSDEVTRTEFRIQSVSGEYRWFESQAANYLGHEPIDGLLASTREITERKETERALANYASSVTQFQEATRRLLETTDREKMAAITIDGLERAFEFDIAGIWLSNSDRTRLEPAVVTEGEQDILEQPPTYSVDSPSLSWELFERQESRLVREMERHDGRHNPDTPIQSELIVPLGEYGVLNIGSTETDAFDSQDRNRVELWASMVESALARLAEIERLQERERELQRERDRLDEFASFVSHDLRNPLNVAVGRLELAASECSSPHLVEVEQSLDRMDSLIEDVLELARQGSTVGETETVDLQELLSQCWHNVETTDAELVVDTELTIRADRSRLASAVENLFRNAVEHGGDSVTVTVGTLADGTGLYLADDGPGIPDGEHERVFESGYSSTDGGTGLGLAIVRQIVEAHGWEIDASTSADGGARFEITGVEPVA